MEEEEYKEFKEDIEFKGLMISRVPKKVKTIFKDLAKEEFCDDYGMTLREILYSFLEYQRLKQMFFDNELDIQVLLGAKEKIPDEFLREQQRTNIAGEPMKKEEQDGKN